MQTYTVLSADRLDQWGLANNLDELLASIAILVDLSNVSRSHRLVQGNINRVVNTLEPDSDVWYEADRSAKLVADLALVDVVSQAVRNQVVGQELDVVLRRWLGSGAGITGDTENGRLATEMLNQRGNSELSGSSVAAGV